jgi:hypothetical protein
MRTALSAHFLDNPGGLDASAFPGEIVANELDSIAGDMRGSIIDRDCHDDGWVCMGVAVHFVDEIRLCTLAPVRGINGSL